MFLKPQRLYQIYILFTTKNRKTVFWLNCGLNVVIFSNKTQCGDVILNEVKKLIYKTYSPPF